MKYSKPSKKRSSVACLSIAALLAGCSSGTGQSVNLNNGGNSAADPNALKRSAESPIAKQNQNFLQNLSSQIASGNLSLYWAETFLPGVRSAMSPEFMAQTASVLSQSETNLPASMKGQNRVQKKLKQEQLHQLTTIAAPSNEQLDILLQTLPFSTDPNSAEHAVIENYTLLTDVTTQANQNIQRVHELLESNLRESAEVIAEANIAAADPATLQSVHDKIKASESLGNTDYSSLLKQSGLSRLQNGVEPENRENIVKDYLNPALIKILQRDPTTWKATVEAAVLAKAYQQVNATIRAYREFAESFRQTKSEFKTSLASAKDLAGKMASDLKSLNGSPAKAKQLAELLNGKSSDPAVQADFANFTQFKSQIADLSDKSQKVLQGANAFLDLASKAGVSDDVIKVGKTVVSAGTAIASTMAGFAAGGPAGAAVAALSVLGNVLGGPDPANVQILSKLDDLMKGQQQLLEMNKEIIKLQQATLEAISSLADAIAEQHQQEMEAIRTLEREMELVDAKLDTIIQNDFLGCAELLSRRDNNIPLVEQIQLSSRNLVENFGLLQGRMNQVSAENYRACLNGIQTVFSSASHSFFQGGDIPASSETGQNTGKIGMTVQARILEPMITNYLRSDQLWDWNRAYSQGYHLPAVRMSAVAKKYDSTKTYFFGDTQSVENYTYAFDESNGLLGNRRESSKNEYFVNVDKVISYVKTLQALIPVVSYHPGWSVGQLDSTYVSNSLDLANMEQSLGRALQLVETAVVQEALLAGEPVLPLIYKVYADGKGLGDAKDCFTHSTLACMFNADPYLAENFATYFVQQKVAELDKKLKIGAGDRVSGPVDPILYHFVYDELMAENSSSRMYSGQVFSQDFIAHNIAMVDSSLPAEEQVKAPHLVLGDRKVALPTPEEYERDQIRYPKQMKQLVDLELSLSMQLAKMQKLQFNASDIQSYLEFKLIATP